MAANTDVTRIANLAADDLSIPLTLELRTMANGALWPSNIISALTVESNDEGDLQVTYPEELAETIENLEYGDINSLPNAVIRPFIYRSQGKVSSVIEHNALGDLMETVGII